MFSGEKRRFKRRRDQENPFQLAMEGFAILGLIATLGLAVDQHGRSLQSSASPQTEASVDAHK